MKLTQRATTFGGAAAVLPATVLSAMVFSTMPAATAAPDPCAASGIARTVGSVGTNTGIYLDAHPDVNQALTTISQQQAGAQSLVALKSYFDGNPQAGKDLQAIQQPLTGLTTKCNLPITLPQVLSLLQAAQQGGALPGGLPAAGAAAQAVAGTTGTVPLVPAPAAAVPVAPGPSPGPSAATTR